MVHEATKWLPYEVTDHATKGPRTRRIPYSEILAREAGYRNHPAG